MDDETRKQMCIKVLRLVGGLTTSVTVIFETRLTLSNTFVDRVTIYVDCQSFSGESFDIAYSKLEKEVLVWVFTVNWF